MIRPISIFCFAAICLATAKERKIELPVETPKYPPGKGSELFAAHCLTCHSTEYISTQPRMARPFWEGVVLKMKNTFGAPIPEASVGDLTDYLTTNFGK